jgi:hypothetical protein
MPLDLVKTEREYEIMLTLLEWEIIDSALQMPIRDALISRIRNYLEMPVSKEEILDAWDSVQEKFHATY